MKKLIIKKGHHYPCPIDFGGFLLKRFKPGMVYQLFTHFKFNDTCVYDIDKDQSDVNKLIGVSLGNHHKNSIRVGWRCKENSIEICGYLYQNGMRKPTIVITSIPVTVCEFDLLLKYNSRIGTVSAELRQGSFIIGADVWQFQYPYKKACWSYGLGLYFGGNRTAPKDMYIERCDTKVKFFKG